MHFKPIKSEADYDAALAMIDGLMGAAPRTSAGDELEALVPLVEAYEAVRWPIGAFGMPRRPVAYDKTTWPR